MGFAAIEIQKGLAPGTVGRNGTPQGTLGGLTGSWKRWG
jgi:hypothetical protein